MFRLHYCRLKHGIHLRAAALYSDCNSLTTGNLVGRGRVQFSLYVQITLFFFIKTVVHFKLYVQRLLLIFKELRIRLHVLSYSQDG